MLAEGGNAVDACIAAAFASCVVDSTLTGPGGGGFMLVHRARDRSDALLDFFVPSPAPASTAGRIEMEAVDVDYDGLLDAGLPHRRGLVRGARRRRRASPPRTARTRRGRGPS